MALNTKVFATRTLSAIVFGVLLIGSVYWNYYSFSVFFFVVVQSYQNAAIVVVIVVVVVVLLEWKVAALSYDRCLTNN